MIRRLLQRLTYANVIATIALFIALGGTSYAALKLPRNSVGATQIRTGAIRSSEVKDRSLQVRDLSLSAREELQGERGPIGPQGAPGSSGAAGTAGSGSGTTVIAASGVAITSKSLVATAAPATGDANDPTTTTTVASVSCDGGQKVVGGGARMDDIGNTAISDSYPEPNGTTWTVHVGNDQMANNTFTVFAVCVA